jgi:hypothetical protein
MFVADLKEGQFEELLHIPEPWYIDRVDFSLEAKQLNVYVKFRERALFPCAKCGAPNQPVRDIANFRTASKWLRSLVEKGWMEPIARGKDVRYYELKEGMLEHLV